MISDTEVILAIYMHWKYEWIIYYILLCICLRMVLRQFSNTIGRTIFFSTKTDLKNFMGLLCKHDHKF